MYTDITSILAWFYGFIHTKSSPEYAQSILACTENTRRAFKRIRRIRQEYFAVYEEYADRHKTGLSRRIFDQNQKNSDYKSL